MIRTKGEPGLVSKNGVLQSAASVIRHARRAIERHGLAGVYLATDSDDQEEMQEVRRALVPVRYGPAVASHRPIDEVFAAAPNPAETAAAAGPLTSSAASR